MFFPEFFNLNALFQETFLLFSKEKIQMKNYVK